MVAAIAATFDSHPLAGRGCELAQHHRGDRLLSRAVQHGLGPRGVGLGLVSNRFQSVDPLLQARVVQIGDTGLYGVIEPLEPEVSLRRAFVQLGDMLAPPLCALLAAVEHGGENFLQSLGSQQAVLNMPGNERVQLLHRYAASNTASLSLPGLGRAGVVAVSITFAGPERHRARAFGAEANTGQQGRPADDASWRNLGVARSQMRPHRIERGLIDQGWDLNGIISLTGFSSWLLLRLLNSCRPT